MVLSKRYCVEYVDGTVECFRDGFWYSDTGVVIKWAILAAIFLLFIGWFLGGYLHAKARMKKGKPLLRYHRWLVSYQDRRAAGQTRQNHVEYYQHAPSMQFGPRPDGTWPQPPPAYGGEQPPRYGAEPLPVGASKMDPSQQGGAVEMAPYPPLPPPQQQQQQQQTGGAPQGGAQLPPRPPMQVKLAGLLGKLRR